MFHKNNFSSRIVDAEMNWHFFVEEGSGPALYKSTWREFLDANRLAILIARLKCTHTLWRALRFRHRAQGACALHHCPNGNCFRSSLVHPWFTGFSWWIADTKYFGKKNVSQRFFFHLCHLPFPLILFRKLFRSTGVGCQVENFINITK